MEMVAALVAVVLKMCFAARPAAVQAHAVPIDYPRVSALNHSIINRHAANLAYTCCDVRSTLGAVALRACSWANHDGAAIDVFYPRWAATTFCAGLNNWLRIRMDCIAFFASNHRYRTLCLLELFPA